MFSRKILITIVLILAMIASSSLHTFELGDSSTSKHGYYASMYSNLKHYLLDVMDVDEIYIENLSTHGWVGKYSVWFEEFQNVTGIDICRDPQNDYRGYATIVTTSPNGENITFLFQVLIIDYNRANIDGRYVYLNYTPISNLSIDVNASLSPMLSGLDTIILDNGTFILAFSITTTQWSLKLKVSQIYVYKYENINIANKQLILVEKITEYSIGYYFFTVGLELDCVETDFVLAFAYGYYVYVWGWGVFVAYGLNISYWWEGGFNSTLVDFSIYDKIISISNVILDDDVVYVACTMHWNQVDLDFICPIAWNITENYTTVAWTAVASFYTEYFGEPPSYRYISITLYNDTNNMLIVWEGHTEFRQYLFYLQYYVGNITNNSHMTLLHEDIIFESNSPSHIISLDENYFDFEASFLLLELDISTNRHVPSHLIPIYDPYNNTFVWNQTHHLDLGNIKMYDMSVITSDNGDIFGCLLYMNKTIWRWAPLVIYRDIDMDFLGDWEELNIIGTDAFNYDTDGDGIPDGSEVYLYNTDPLLFDTDGDRLDDKFELEVKPDRTYSKYGDIPNLFQTDPLDNDTDNDGLSDFYEVVGNYTINGRKGYATNPTKNDTDGDRLGDYEEIVIGVEYWINETDKKYNSPSNATIADTDGDGLTDYEEKQLLLNPSSPDTDNDGLNDYLELNVYGTNPHVSDSDNDGLLDGVEIDLGTDVSNSDTDGDGLTDGDEINKYNTDPFVQDSDGDGLNDYDEVIVYKTDPMNSDTDGDGLLDLDEINRRLDPHRKDTDGDGIPDKYDLMLPAFPDYIIVVIILLVIGIYKAYSYGLFRNWKKDILAFGVADIGGVPIAIVPEDFKTIYDPNLISSGLLGIHTLTSEITGKELKRLILSGEVPIYIGKEENSIIFVFIKREYPKIMKQLHRIHTELEETYATLLQSWSGLVEEAEELIIWLKTKLGI